MNPGVRGLSLTRRLPLCMTLSEYKPIPGIDGPIQSLDPYPEWLDEPGWPHQTAAHGNRPNLPASAPGEIQDPVALPVSSPQSLRRIFPCMLDKGRATSGPRHNSDLIRWRVITGHRWPASPSRNKA